MASSTNNIACPKCETFLRPPLTMCKDRHWLCKNCCQHIDAVTGEPVASETCGEDKYPMELLNKLFRNLTDQCQYGCRRRANVLDLAEHEAACPLTPKCSINSCHWRGQNRKLIKHVEDDHPERLVHISAVQHSFTLGFKQPVLLLTQWDKTSPNNAFYWLRLLKNGNGQFIMMQYAFKTGQKVEDKFLVKEYCVSPVNYPKLSLNIEVVFTKSDEDDILNDKFVESQGTDVTVFNSDEFLIKIKDVSPQISESDAFAVQHNFTLGFKNPVLLLTQWEKTSPNNASYRLCLHKNGSSQFIIMQYAGQTGRMVEKNFLLKEYSVSPVSYPKLPVNIEVVFTKCDEDDILNDKFVESQGTDVTVFNSDEFLIKIKSVLPLISAYLALN